MPTHTDGHKSLQELLGKEVDTSFGSGLVINAARAWEKSINDLTNEDIRLLIGQHMGLEHLIPIVITKLEDDILSSGDHFEGDLLLSVLSVERKFWDQNPELFTKFKNLLIKKSDEITDPVFDDRSDMDYYRANILPQILSKVDKMI